MSFGPSRLYSILVIALLVLAALSPDGRLQAAYENEQVVITNRAGALVRRLSLEPRITRSIDDVVWINNRLLGVEGGINPSIAQFRRFDVATGRELKDLLGLRFTPCAAAGEVAHTAWVPHFVEDLELHSQHVQVDGRDVFDSRKKGEMHSIEGFAWSQDCSLLAFVDEEANGDTETVIVLRGGKVLARFPLPAEHHSARPTRVGRDAIELISPAGPLSFPLAH
jgi:hypothetical protein